MADLIPIGMLLIIKAITSIIAVPVRTRGFLLYVITYPRPTIVPGIAIAIIVVNSIKLFPTNLFLTIRKAIIIAKRPVIGVDIRARAVVSTIGFIPILSTYL